MKPPVLDVVIPVYNEGSGIHKVLAAFRSQVRTPFRILVCYDFPEDTTLAAIESFEGRGDLDLRLVKNPERGPNQAVKAGLEASTAPFVLVHMADDDYNVGMVDHMVARMAAGYDIVAPSRFLNGKRSEGAPWLKEALSRVSSFTLRHFARLPVHDATNAFRLFSRRLVDSLEIESEKGFCFTLELLAKADRLGLPVAEVEADWFERHEGSGNFKVFAWIPAYLRWYLYAFATTWLRLGPRSVALKPGAPLA